MGFIMVLVVVHHHVWLSLLRCRRIKGEQWRWWNLWKAEVPPKGCPLFMDGFKSMCFDLVYGAKGEQEWDENPHSL